MLWSFQPCTSLVFYLYWRHQFVTWFLQMRYCKDIFTFTTHANSFCYQGHPIRHMSLFCRYFRLKVVILTIYWRPMSIRNVSCDAPCPIEPMRSFPFSIIYSSKPSINLGWDFNSIFWLMFIVDRRFPPGVDRLNKQYPKLT